MNNNFYYIRASFYYESDTITARELPTLKQKTFTLYEQSVVSKNIYCIFRLKPYGERFKDNGNNDYLFNEDKYYVIEGTRSNRIKLTDLQVLINKGQACTLKKFMSRCFNLIATPLMFDSYALNLHNCNIEMDGLRLKGFGDRFDFTFVIEFLNSDSNDRLIVLRKETSNVYVNGISICTNAKHLILSDFSFNLSEYPKGDCYIIYLNMGVKTARLNVHLDGRIDIDINSKRLQASTKLLTFNQFFMLSGGK